MDTNKSVAEIQHKGFNINFFQDTSPGSPITDWDETGEWYDTGYGVHDYHHGETEFQDEQYLEPKALAKFRSQTRENIKEYNLFTVGVQSDGTHKLKRVITNENDLVKESYSEELGGNIHKVNYDAELLVKIPKSQVNYVGRSALRKKTEMMDKITATVSQWAKGQVFGFVITDEDGEEIDVGFGYYDKLGFWDNFEEDTDCEICTTVKDAINHEIEKRERKRKAALRQMISENAPIDIHVKEAV